MTTDFVNREKTLTSLQRLVHEFESKIVLDETDKFYFTVDRKVCRKELELFLDEKTSFALQHCDSVYDELTRIIGEGRELVEMDAEQQVKKAYFVLQIFSLLTLCKANSQRALFSV